MNSMNEPVLTLKIRLLESYEIASEKKKVCQILFDGHADGRYFQGDILPGAVDTQMIEPDGSGILNARYTLKGKDAAGENCLLFIENTANLGESDTRPEIVTDSRQLAWMNDAQFSGFMKVEGDSLLIEIRRDNTL